MDSQKQNPDEIPEIVGSKDLRQVFAEKGELKGSFFINNIEFHQARFNSPESVIGLINAKENEAYVTASVDDGFHLVLEAHSPAPIVIRPGKEYIETPPVGDAAATGAAVKAAIEATKADTDKKETKNTILEDLGLPIDKEASSQPVPGGMSAGLKADERHKRRHAAAVARGAIRGVPDAPAQSAGSGSRLVPSTAGADDNRRFNPVTPADKVMPPGGFPPNPQDNAGRVALGPSPWENNPKVQVAPSSNSDGQPTMDDLQRHPS